MKKELFVFVFVTLINLGAQIQGAQTQYTVVNFGLDQPLAYDHDFWYTCVNSLGNC